MANLIDNLNAGGLREEKYSFSIGDTVAVHYRIREGDKERVQVFVGTVIARKHGGIQETFTVRRIVAGEGVERVFPLHSPRIADIRVRRRGKVRRAKLYYLRSRVGKATRVREKRLVGGKVKKAAPRQPVAIPAETAKVEQQGS